MRQNRIASTAVSHRVWMSGEVLLLVSPRKTPCTMNHNWKQTPQSTHNKAHPLTNTVPLQQVSDTDATTPLSTWRRSGFQVVPAGSRDSLACCKPPSESKPLNMGKLMPSIPSPTTGVLLGWERHSQGCHLYSQSMILS